jgi:poly-beta-hydroxyalkanoate depolymerase
MKKKLYRILEVLDFTENSYTLYFFSDYNNVNQLTREYIFNTLNKTFEIVNKEN